MKKKQPIESPDGVRNLLQDAIRRLDVADHLIRPEYDPDPRLTEQIELVGGWVHSAITEMMREYEDHEAVALVIARQLDRASWTILDLVGEQYGELCPGMIGELNTAKIEIDAARYQIDVKDPWHGLIQPGFSKL